MMSRPITRGVCVVAMMVALLIPFPVHGETPATRKTTTQPSPEKRAARVAQLEAYYAELYAKALEEKTRLSQLVGVVSLARVGGEPVTKKLLGALATEDVLVAQLVWEALHARQETLEKADRVKWLNGGLEIARRGGFPGETIAPLLTALSERPATELKGLTDVLLRVAGENDPATTEGKIALDAGKAAVAHWREPKIVLQLVAKVKANPQWADRVGVLLSGLPEAPEGATDPAKMQGIWGRHVRVSKMAPPTTRPAYAGTSALFDPPEEIENPDDPKWRRDLELPRFDFEGVDVAFCIDATGSMAASNEYVTSYIEAIVELLHLMSDEVRGGAVYYRHETDAALMAQCCRDAEQGGGFRVRTLPFTSDPAALVTLMRAQKMAGRTGHDKGAYVGGIATAMKTMPWGKNSKRVIAFTGDAATTPGSEKALVEIAEKAKADEFLLLFVVRDAKASKAVASASAAATGFEPIVYGEDIKKLSGATTKPSNGKPTARLQGTAFEKMTVRVLELSLPEAYRDRAEPLVRAVLPILQAQGALPKSTKGAKK